MEMCYKSRGLSKYLEINVGTDSYLKEKGYIYQIHMLEENSIRHLLKVTSVYIDGSIRLKYETGAMYVADRYIREYKVNGTLLSTWLGQILDCITNMESYLLNPDNLIINPDYMFLDNPGDGLFMVYAVGYEKSAAAQIKEFIEYCMQRFDSRDRAGINYLYTVHEYVSGDKISFGELKRLVTGGTESGYGGGQQDMLEYSEVHSYDEACAEKAETFEDAADTVKKLKNIPPFRILILAVNIIAAAALFIKYAMGRDRLILYAAVLLVVVFIVHLILCMGEPEDDIDEIMREYKKDVKYASTGEYKEKNDRDILSEDLYAADKRQQEYESINKLVPLTNGGLSDMDLSGLAMPCVIGRGRENVSYRINTTQISRIHACIYNVNDEYYIEDRESTNGTYVNSVKIGAYERVKLSKGDIVGFANEEFFVS